MCVCDGGCGCVVVGGRLAGQAGQKAKWEVYNAMQVAAKMYRQAVEWMEESGKDALAGDVFR